MTDWRERAACRGEENDYKWFPSERGDAGEAKATCADCPVRAQCLEFALDNNEGYGVWGGLDPAERQSLRRRLQRYGDPVSRKHNTPLVHGTEYAYRREVTRGEEPCEPCTAARDRANAARSKVSGGNRAKPWSEAARAVANGRVGGRRAL